MVLNVFEREARRMLYTLFYQDINVVDFYDLEDLGNEERTYTDYFKDCSKVFDLVAKELDGLPHKSCDVEKLLSDFKQSSVSVGAIKVQHSINNLEECLPRANKSECYIAFSRIKDDFERLRNTLATYFELRYRSPSVRDEARQRLFMH